ncbi:hypothetical protein BC832DRAFT_3070 [Gaertneriomyces semiglobifer]|nr:hypothetical protein BC832DRAFT_3070 [Gaertneriomyces semiglobifer]
MVIDAYKSACRTSLILEADLTRPLEQKPSVIPVDADGNLPEHVQQEYEEFRKNYFAANNLLSDDDLARLYDIHQTLNARRMQLASSNPITQSFFAQPDESLVAAFGRFNIRIAPALVWKTRRSGHCKGKAATNATVRIGTATVCCLLIIASVVCLFVL